MSSAHQRSRLKKENELNSRCFALAEQAKAKYNGCEEQTLHAILPISSTSPMTQANESNCCWEKEQARRLRSSHNQGTKNGNRRAQKA
jgi:hypothetical protein